MKEEHPFIKETIKKEPRDTAALVKKAVSFAAGGVIFGICAAVSMAFFMPVAGEIIGTTPTPRPLVTLSPGEETEGEASAQDPEDLPVQADSGDTAVIPRPLEYYENIYDEVLRVSEEPRKALVHVCAIRSGENLLDDSLLHWGDEEGIIFLCNDSDYYILTTCETLMKSDRIQVTFSDGSSARGVLCKADERTGLGVVRVPAANLSEQTRQEISAAKLSASGSLLPAKPVIAIGSPEGDRDAVEYGMITSVSGKYSVADAEFSLLTTDMRGSTGGTGFLLDIQGEVTGVILRTGEDSNIVRAISAVQLRPLIQILSNGESIRYLGVKGTAVTAARAQSLGIPEGIYVESVEADSPAMRAGILSGDIITSLGADEVKTMEDYTSALQELSVGGQTAVTLRRRAAEGLFQEMKLRMTVGGK